MKTLQKVVLVSFFYVLLVGPNTLTASELVHDFSNPAFNGSGYSSHVLSIEQLQHNREKQAKDDAKSAASAAERAENNTTINKFIKNENLSPLNGDKFKIALYSDSTEELGVLNYCSC